MINLSPEAVKYFSSPLTGALFDRTPQQRRRHSELDSMYRRGVAQQERTVDPTVYANAAMFAEFVVQIDVDVRDRTHTLIVEAVSQGPAVDEAALATSARADVLGYYADLHATLPIPALDWAAAQDRQDV
jgi:hypothetical protein